MARFRPFLVASCLALAFICLSTHVSGVDRGKFRTCQHTDFCQRLRSNKGHPSMNYKIEASQVTFDSQSASISLPFTSTLYPGQPALNGRLSIHNESVEGTPMCGIIRLTAVESQGKFPRHPLQDVVQEPAVRAFVGTIAFEKFDDRAEASWTMQGRGDSYRKPEGASFAFTQNNLSHKNKVVIQYAPFKLTFSVDDVVVMLANGDNLMHFEQYRDRNPRAAPPQEPRAPTNMEEFTPEQQADAQALYQSQLSQYHTDLAAFQSGSAPAVWPEDTPGSWEESFGSHQDVKARGPAAIGLDVEFVNAKHVYGIPEHASSFSLKNTLGEEPYRLYNLDVFEYDLNEQMALYGAVPYVASHTQDGRFSSGMLWLNAAETYVDISESGGSFLGVGSEPIKKRVHWFSETGMLDAFFLLGPQPSDIFYQYSSLTGFPFLPPLFSIGYHQCRWNYKSSDDVLGVDEGFDREDMPMDTIWLDIEHTEAKKYFTWDKSNFPQPLDMQAKLAAKGRNLVTIVDPHIKRDSGYKVHQDATSLGHYIKKKDGHTDYDGWCWPGSSSYLDFFQSKVRKFWGDHFSYDQYPDSAKNLFIWNDMNEPSVFNGPEVTMPKDNVHTLDGVNGVVEHREVHNQYGYFVHKATHEGLIARDQGRQRPFVLTRSFFAGSQRSAAVWTGDNMAKWDHLAAAQPMLLSLATAQIPFSGADVGGFFGEPDAQLFTRWFQAAAFHPFFRGHAHIDTKRREPWIFGEPYTSIIRAALRTRYAYLPYLYTLFYLNSLNGMPILRPLWVQFPSDPKTAGLENEFLLGSALLVKPVVEPDVTTTLVYLPAGPSGVQEQWFDLSLDTVHAGGDTVNVLTPLQHIPVFQRGGSIIAKRERARRNSKLMQHDPYTLVVALSTQQSASGMLFIDDANSYAYQQPGGSIVQHFSLSSDGVLSGTLQAESSFADHNTIERIVILGSTFTQATIVAGVDAQGRPVNNVALAVQATNGGRRLVIRKPDIRIGSNFQIKLQ